MALFAAHRARVERVDGVEVRRGLGHAEGLEHAGVLGRRVELPEDGRGQPREAVRYDHRGLPRRRDFGRHELEDDHAARAHEHGGVGVVFVVGPGAHEQVVDARRVEGVEVAVERRREEHRRVVQHGVELPRADGAGPARVEDGLGLQDRRVAGPRAHVDRVEPKVLRGRGAFFSGGRDERRRARPCCCSGTRRRRPRGGCPRRCRATRARSCSTRPCCCRTQSSAGPGTARAGTCRRRRSTSADPTRRRCSCPCRGRSRPRRPRPRGRGRVAGTAMACPCGERGQEAPPCCPGVFSSTVESEALSIRWSQDLMNEEQPLFVSR